jgi:cellulose synthase/poly-beta-1,6-N-acetylglucosamine synthase-like glycosyltransferase
LALGYWIPLASPREDRPWPVTLMIVAFLVVLTLIAVYIVRHYLFTINRLYARPRRPYLDVDTADWPPVTILIPAHNEEEVIGEILEALLAVDYPRDRLTLMPIDDRSKDGTGRIIGEYAAANPGLVVPFERRDGMPGKAAALKDAMGRVTTEVVLVFDADYIPGRGLIKQLVAPFFDPEVGAVMGRVVPHNVGENLLTRLLDLERSAGYQVDQQARMNLRLVPQYGGTVGGVRRSALASLGGWRDRSLAEDTDATYRLLLGGYKTVYQNRSECYEQAPETWPTRIRQIMRWARGHNQSAARYGARLLFNRRTRIAERVDGALLLGVFLMSPVLLAGWSLGVALWYLGELRSSLLIILAVTSYNTVGNFAILFEIAAAAYLDGSRNRIRLLPFLILNFLVSLFSVSRASIVQVVFRSENEKVLWHKTERTNGNGVRNGNGKRKTNGRVGP